MCEEQKKTYCSIFFWTDVHFTDPQNRKIFITEKLYMISKYFYVMKNIFTKIYISVTSQ